MLVLYKHTRASHLRKVVLGLVIGHGPLSQTIWVLHCHVHAAILLLHAYHVELLCVLLLLLLLGCHIRAHVTQQILLRVLAYSGLVLCTSQSSHNVGNAIGHRSPFTYLCVIHISADLWVDGTVGSVALALVSGGEHVPKQIEPFE